MVLIQSYLNAAFYRCEYIKNFPGLGKDEKLFKYKWLFKILLLMLDSFPKSAELNQGRRNPPALNYIKERLFPPFFTRVNGDFNLLLIRRGAVRRSRLIETAYLSRELRSWSINCTKWIKLHVRRNWIIEINPYLRIWIRPAQYEVLSSYLSGLVVLARLFYKPYSPAEMQDLLFILELSWKEEPVTVWAYPEVSRTGCFRG